MPLRSVLCDIWPQWSPPVNGGSTRVHQVRTGERDALPQWSPPVNGGSTRSTRWTMPGRSRCRNGARR